MSERYLKIIEKLKKNELIIHDGAIGTELQKRGVSMDGSWCGTASLQDNILKQVHTDYILAGSQIITTNTYASSRIMLKSAGFEKRFKEVNLKAVESALKAREETGYKDVIVAGSISHRYPIADGDTISNASIQVSKLELQEATEEMALLLTKNGCDVILLEMMYRPERMKIIFDIVKKLNIPIWVCFSCRKSEKGEILSLTDETIVPFSELIAISKEYNFDALGIMHTSEDILGECINMIKTNFNGPILAYPDTGGWLSPNWIFDTVIEPEKFREKAKDWYALGAQIIGGCCGTSPDHIRALTTLK